LYTVYGVHIGKFHMLIFNRWGEIIFESNHMKDVWDGNYRNEPMPIGVYEWLITYEGDSEKYKGPYKMKGSVTVVR
ncbi:MAG TPA: gliding motility-associated C-terminal domain-containing protein, partial [Cytophagales bacterium]|nr:gliding motility-associated C-terminal domain-containing protein [Cytophagales bacterium]